MNKKNQKKIKSDTLSGKAMIAFTSLIALLGGMIYLNSINGQFIWDDQHLIVNNPMIKDWSYLPQIFSGNIAAGAGLDYPFYRPVLMLTLMFDYALFGLKVQGYHVMTIFMHILAAIMLFLLIKNLINNAKIAFISALLFVTHPIHTENVAYITGRAEPLILIFIFISFLYYLKFNDSNNYTSLILCLTSFVTALLIKENSVVLPALIILYHVVFRKRINIISLLPIIVIASVYTWLRLFVFSGALSNVSGAGTLGARIPGFFVALTNYVCLMFAPFDLHMEYGSKLFPMSHPKAIVGAIIFLFSAFLFIRFLKNKPLYAFSIGWFFVALLPVSNTIYPASDYMAERYMYLPSLGIFLPIAHVMISIYDRKKYRLFSIVAGIGLLSFYSVLTVRQNSYWRDPVTFYERTLGYAPDSAALYNNLGSEYRKNGSLEKAIEMYRKSIKVSPNNPRGYNNLGITLVAAGREREAEEAFGQSLAADSRFSVAYYNLSLLYYRRQRYDLALSYSEKALKWGYRVNPEYMHQLEIANNRR